jgi:DNA-binding Xre family transcriptional regulator
LTLGSVLPSRPDDAAETIVAKRSFSYFPIRTMWMLELLATKRCSTRELADHLMIDPRTARRLLYGLMIDRYVLREPGNRGRYYASPTLAFLGDRLAAKYPKPARRHHGQPLTPQQQLGQNLRRERLARELRQRDLSERIGMDASYYARIERGDVDPLLPTMLRVATGLDLTLTALVRGITRRSDPVRTEAHHVG